MMADGPQYPYGNLVPLRIGGVDYPVPENSSLLRCFQYLQLYPISMGGFCWNADCHTCEVAIQEGEERKKVLSCQTTVVPGMVIVEMTDKLKFCLRELLKK
jgi:predicted molibdopterin-dependent oxidoreductase YjgC